MPKLKSTFCKVSGCGRHELARGYCPPHYDRFRIHGDPLGGGTVRGSAQAYLEKVRSYDGLDCLIWPFTKSSNGYAQVGGPHGMMLVHRLACEEEHGAAPIDKPNALHNCGNGHKGCVTRKHLRWGAQIENKADELIHGTRNYGERNGASKLNEEAIEAIRELTGKTTQKSIAEMFGVHRTTIRNVQRGISWSTVQ